jgi:hypothetical protein
MEAIAIADELLDNKTDCFTKNKKGAIQKLLQLKRGIFQNGKNICVNE